jgi:hypothetical protein
MLNKLSGNINQSNLMGCPPIQCMRRSSQPVENVGISSNVIHVRPHANIGKVLTTHNYWLHAMKGCTYFFLCFSNCSSCMISSFSHFC